MGLPIPQVPVAATVLQGRHGSAGEPLQPGIIRWGPTSVAAAGLGVATPASIPAAGGGKAAALAVEEPPSTPVAAPRQQRTHSFESPPPHKRAKHDGGDHTRALQPHPHQADYGVGAVAGLAGSCLDHCPQGPLAAEQCGASSASPEAGGFAMLTSGGCDSTLQAAAVAPHVATVDMLVAACDGVLAATETLFPGLSTTALESLVDTLGAAPGWPAVRQSQVVHFLLPALQRAARVGGEAGARRAVAVVKTVLSVDLLLGAP